MHIYLVAKSGAVSLYAHFVHMCAVCIRYTCNLSKGTSYQITCVCMIRMNGHYLSLNYCITAI